MGKASLGSKSCYVITLVSYPGFAETSLGTAKNKRRIKAELQHKPHFYWNIMTLHACLKETKCMTWCFCHASGTSNLPRFPSLCDLWNCLEGKSQYFYRNNCLIFFFYVLKYNASSKNPYLSAIVRHLSLKRGTQIILEQAVARITLS